MSFYGQVVDAEKLRQERDQWQAEALRWREKNETLATIVASLESERNTRRKRLESATEFVFHRHATKAMEFSKAIRVRLHSDDKWSICYVKEGSVFSVFPDGKNVFDTFEEAEAAAKKALEVAG